MQSVDGRLDRVRVKNFKGLENVEIELGQFNVLIGPNGSGKTNILEFFSFLDSYMHNLNRFKNPFSPWGGFKNLVWAGDESLPISFEIQYSMHDRQVTYSASISGTEDSISYISESIHVENLLNLRRRGGFVECIMSENILNDNRHSMPKKIWGYEDFVKELYDHKPRKIPPYFSILLASCSGASGPYSGNSNLSTGQITIRDKMNNYQNIPYVAPLIPSNGLSLPLYPNIKNFLFNLGIRFLRNINLDVIRKPGNCEIDKLQLGENAENLVGVLFKLYKKNAERMPDKILYALKDLFPGWLVEFSITGNNEITLYVKEGDVALAPACIPDGFYKLLAILVALELNPRILMIDEIENSLHARIIEYLVDVFKTSDTVVIVTTHSPIMVDMVDLEDLLVLERGIKGTKLHRVKDPDKVKSKLMQSGVTVSESWLYAKL